MLSISFFSVNNYRFRSLILIFFWFICSTVECGYFNKHGWTRLRVTSVTIIIYYYYYYYYDIIIAEEIISKIEMCLGFQIIVYTYSARSILVTRLISRRKVSTLTLLRMFINFDLLFHTYDMHNLVFIILTFTYGSFDLFKAVYICVFVKKGTSFLRVSLFSLNYR